MSENATTVRDLDGRVAVVTGASRGMGREIARGLAARGARVGLLARSADALTDAVAQIRGEGGMATGHAVDLADAASTAAALDAVVAEFGPVGILINNAAAITPMGASVALSSEAIRATLTLNIAVAIELSTAVLPGMLSAGWGQIVNVSSRAAGAPDSMVGGNVYTTTKVALEGHTINLAAELAGSDVAVNVYRPGSVDTAMQEWIREQSPEAVGDRLHRHFVRRHEGGHLISPADAAADLLGHLPAAESGQIWSGD